MALEMLAKDENSGMNGCPSIYAVTDRPGMAGVQGVAMDDATAAQMVNLLPGESGVFIAEDVILAAAAVIIRRRRA